MFYEELEIGFNDIEYMWGTLVAVWVSLASSKKTSYAWKQRRLFYAIAVINYIGKSWHLYDLSYLRIDQLDVVFNMLGLYSVVQFQTLQNISNSQIQHTYFAKQELCFASWNCNFSSHLLTKRKMIDILVDHQRST